jgi:rubrerythrin
LNKEIEKQVKMLFKIGELTAKCPYCNMTVGTLSKASCPLCNKETDISNVLFFKNEKNNSN